MGEFWTKSRWQCTECDASGEAESDTPGLFDESAYNHVRDTGHKVEVFTEGKRTLTPELITGGIPRPKRPRYHHEQVDVRARCLDCGETWQASTAEEADQFFNDTHKHVAKHEHTVVVESGAERGILKVDPPKPYEVRDSEVQPTPLAVVRDEPEALMAGAEIGAGANLSDDPFFKEILQSFAHEITTADHIHLKALMQACENMAPRISGMVPQLISEFESEYEQPLPEGAPRLANERFMYLAKKFVTAFAARADFLGEVNEGEEWKKGHGEEEEA